jgi:hypothetical protein
VIRRLLASAAPAFASLLPALILLVGCSAPLDAGRDRDVSLLPVDARNPILLINDGPHDNWQGEYALLLSHAAGPKLAGIIVNESGPWPDLEANLSGWQDLVSAARASGLEPAPDPLPSSSPALVPPEDGDIDSTTPNDSAGARFIIERSSELAEPDTPLVVVTGGKLTDVADAYLLDPAVVDRIVVVAALGTLEGSAARMGIPNGEMDPWADTIVADKFRYIQVSAYYDQLTGVPPERLTELPPNAFGDWIAAKQPLIFDLDLAADQVAVAALGVPDFVQAVTRASPSSTPTPPAGEGPTLEPDPEGHAWVVTAIDGAAATQRFWELLDAGP